MFSPTRDQVRSFFIDTWRKHQQHERLTPLETIAAGIVIEHPEYHALLDSPTARSREFRPEDGKINPFLHLSLHLAIEEQISIDQPPGIRAAFDALCQRRGERHGAMHDTLECLGETLYEAQRDQASPDGQAYLIRIQQRAGLLTGATL
ncbi:hypothetical protein AGMMS50225_15530 [Betaproteobacteria bacterium]|nr:hypothetical protein AGMMS50225_15530 [Betaproteobacteria bacterium]